jgi:hypothetical protein
MQKLAEISDWIRDYGHDPRHMQRLLSLRFDWHQLWTALDIIDDVDLAISAYLEAEFPTDPGEQYLRVYGVFQALFVQQDALSHFVEVLRPAMSINITDVLKDVREARNAAVGHPTKLKRKGELSTHVISRITMSKDGFDLAPFSEKDGVSVRYVPVRDLIEKQRAQAVRILSEVVKELKEEDKAHKAVFREKKLRNSFSQVLYAFEKISEDLRKNSAVTMGAWGADHLQSSLDEFEELLKERGLGVDTYDSVQYRYNQIKYPLTELRKFFAGEASDIPSCKAAVVFADALRSAFSGLMDIAEEIDRDYMSVPE